VPTVVMIVEGWVQTTGTAGVGAGVVGAGVGGAAVVVVVLTPGAGVPPGAAVAPGAGVAPGAAEVGATVVVVVVGGSVALVPLTTR
jgi:hypothetical protein